MPFSLSTLSLRASISQHAKHALTQRGALTMRKAFGARIFAWAAVASLCLSGASVTMTTDAYAQKRPKKGAPAPKPKPQQPAAPAAPAHGGSDIELDEEKPAAGQPAAKPVDNSPPPQAGQMTEQAAQAKRLFDGEKWSDAALALYRV